MPLLIGITGGIGSGQSTVAGTMQQLGARIVNADKMAHRIVNYNPEAKSQIKKAFGRNVYYRNGKLNRRLLGEIVFKNERKLQKLNEIVHPLMISMIVDDVEKAKESGRHRIIAIDAALIYEVQIERIFDAVIVVSSRKQNRIARVIERDKLPEAQILARMEQQLPLEEKVKWADIVINNNSTLEKLEERTKAVYKQLLNKSAPKQKKPRNFKKNTKVRRKGGDDGKRE